MAQKNIVLAILDGWGIGRHDESNPIYIVQPATFARLATDYPVTSLQASGIAVGLPWGEVGNSEVGHLTLGAGKVLYQYYPKIMMAIQDGSFFENPVLKAACAHAKQTGGALNLAGLLTDANIHSSLDHLKALIDMAHREGVAKINLHLFADGKDSAPRSLQKLLAQLPKELLATLIGRYYAMDREDKWQLTETAYLAMTGHAGQIVSDPNPTIEATYKRGDTEEYLPAMRFASSPRRGEVDPSAGPKGLSEKPEKTTNRGISDDDALIFFNYREDSIRQIASAFILKDFDSFKRVPFQNLYVATFTHYDDRFDVPVAFKADTVEEPLGKVLADQNLTQLRVAETYKYAHVTYFFNGLREPPFQGEYRTLVPSETDLHPEKHPEMMAKAVTDRVLEAIQSRAFPFVLVNYANADTIGHTSDYNAALEAVRVLDREVGRLVAAAEEAGATLLITADHGHIEEMINPMTGLPQSQHVASPVPFYLVDKKYRGRRFINAENYESETLGSLADVAPTILELMNIAKPAEMTGDSLLDKLR
jgi:2,3-bisphosphoglycerate-independent phosphoglycerate mutase